MGLQYTQRDGSPIDYVQLFKTLYEQTPERHSKVDIGFRADAIKAVQSLFEKLAQMTESLEQTRRANAPAALDYGELVAKIQAKREEANALREAERKGTLLAEGENAFLRLDEEFFPEPNSFSKFLVKVTYLMLPHNELHLVRKDFLNQLVGFLLNVLPEKARLDIKGYIEDARMAGLAIDIIEPSIKEHATTSASQSAILETARVALEERFTVYLKG